MINVALNPIVAGLLPPKRKEKLVAEIAAHEEAQASKTDDERRAIIAAAHAPGADPRLRAELAAARERVIRLNVWADNVDLALFAQEDLADDEWIQVVNRRDQAFNVLETHVHGMAPKQSFAVEHDTTRYKVDRFDTGVIEYPTEDGLLGRLNVADEVNRDLIRSWDILINTNLRALIAAAITAFTAGTTYVRDSRITGMPTTNDLSLSTGNYFTFEAFKECVDHYDLLGKALRLIRMHPSLMRDTWDWQHLVSDSAGGGADDARTLITTRVKEGIMDTGRPSGAILGRNVTYLLDPTFADGELQIFSNEPCGTFYEKPGLAQVFDLDELFMMGMFQKQNVRGVLKAGHFKGLIVGPDALNVAQLELAS